MPGARNEWLLHLLMKSVEMAAGLEPVRREVEIALPGDRPCRVTIEIRKATSLPSGKVIEVLRRLLGLDAQGNQTVPGGAEIPAGLAEFSEEDILSLLEASHARTRT